MIYTLDNTIRAGRPVQRIVDANGIEWKKCIEVDTETGRIVRLKTDANGMIVAENGEIAREEIYAAAPLAVVFKD